MDRNRPHDLLTAHTRVEAAIALLRDAGTDLAPRAGTGDAEPFETSMEIVHRLLMLEQALRLAYAEESV